ncbi:hypothetical protein JFQ86_16400 [Serratia ureilytica]|uniref:hypothetical protein n=1 Tax=Serratia ureilytica TaxID=300181 RepID=UPI0018E8B648|nr:hypothetical protein [Serratia ureilytica]MBJ2114411.1 hypothetical protein [Serratia ureilytica]
MSNIVIIDGDELKFNPQFGLNTVTPPPQTRIRGNGEASIENKKICIVGDEKQVSFTADYIKPPFVATPGNGTLTITQLAPDQWHVFATAQTPVIVVGSQFIAQFQPIKPAQDPQGKPDLDLSPAIGSGKFINSQSFVTAG